MTTHFHCNSLSLFLNYSFDVRGRAFSKALYWSDTNAFGPRAYFLTVSKPATLSVDNVQLDDEGVSFKGYIRNVPFAYHNHACMHALKTHILCHKLLNSILICMRSRCIVVGLISKILRHEIIELT